MNRVSLYSLGFLCSLALSASTALGQGYDPYPSAAAADPYGSQGAYGSNPYGSPTTQKKGFGLNPQSTGGYMRYSFIDGNYTFLDTEINDFEFDASGLEVKLSLNVWQFLFLEGTFQFTSGDGDEDLELLGESIDVEVDADSIGFNLGLGGFIPLSPRFHLGGRTGFVFENIDASIDAASNLLKGTERVDENETGFYLQGFARLMPIDKLELNGKIGYDSVSEEVQFGVGSIVYFTPNFGLTGAIDLSDDIRAYTLGLRLQW